MTKDCPSRRKAAATPQFVRTFDEVFGDFRVTPEERRELVYHLAALRARRTIEVLLGESATVSG